MATAATVLIAGGTGFLGSALRSKLSKRGVNSISISRTKTGHDNSNIITWNEIIEKGIPSNCSSVVSLSGANIAESKWTNERKKVLRESRIDLTKQLVDTIKKTKNNSPQQIKSFIQGSAVGIYPTLSTGTRDPQAVFDEDFKGSATGFAGELVKDWEESSKELESLGIRRCVVRTSVVLDRNHGALPQMLLPFGIGVLGKLADGKQYFPWIHVDDWSEITANFILNNNMQGVYNMVAPEAITNEQFSRALQEATHKIAIPLPGIAVKAIFQERAFLVLEGNKIISKRLEKEAGYKFKYPTIKSALQNSFQT